MEFRPSISLQCKESHVFLINIEVFIKTKGLGSTFLFTKVYEVSAPKRPVWPPIHSMHQKITSHSAKMAAACWHFGHDVNSAYHVITGSVKCPLGVRKRNLMTKIEIFSSNRPLF